MIYDKTYSPPRRSRSALYFPASRLRAGSAVRDVFLVHMRETDGGLVCAEGLEPIEMPFTDVPFKLYVVENEVISVNHVASRNTDGMFAVFAEQNYYGFRLTSMPRSVSAVYFTLNEVRKDTWQLVFSDRTFFCEAEDGQMLDYSQRTGGLFGFPYAGRFFLAKADRIIYTAAYSLKNWAVSTNTDVQASGTLYVPAQCGDLTAGIVYRDDAYFFAQYGVWKLHMGGKVLNTKTVLYPHNCGEVLKNSCQIVDDKIYFLTTTGLWRFDGNKFERVVSPCFDLADFSAEVETGAMNGQYYAHVALRDGNRRIAVYDPRFDRDRFLGCEVASFGAMQKGYAIYGDVICEVTERGLPGGEPCQVMCTLSLDGKNNPCAEWVRVEGEGEFTVEASTPEDGAALCKGKAGEKMYLSRALRGAAVSLCISTRTENFRIAGIGMGIGEDEQYDD